MSAQKSAPNNYSCLQPEFQANVPKAAAFAVAGPVADNKCDMTNLSWTIDGNYLTKKHGIRYPIHPRKVHRIMLCHQELLVCDLMWTT